VLISGMETPVSMNAIKVGMVLLLLKIQFELAQEIKLEQTLYI